MTVSARDVSNLISQLKCGQSAGSDDLCAEHLKFANDKLHTLLSMCFTFFLHTAIVLKPDVRMVSQIHVFITT